MNFLITRDILMNAPILIVDVEKKYLEDEDVYGLISEEYHQEVKDELQNRIEQMCEHLKSINSNHILFTTNDTTLYSKFNDLSFHQLPYWLQFKHKYSHKIIEAPEYLRMVNNNDEEALLYELEINHNIIEHLKVFDRVLICGMWKDRCVFTVTQLLREHGVNAILFDNDIYSIGSEVIGDGYSIEKLIKYHNMNLEYI